MDSSNREILELFSQTVSELVSLSPTMTQHILTHPPAGDPIGDWQRGGGSYSTSLEIEGCQDRAASYHHGRQDANQGSRKPTSIRARLGERAVHSHAQDHRQGHRGPKSLLHRYQRHPG